MKNLEDHINSVIDLLDEKFEEEGYPVSERPLAAAMEYLRLFVVEVSNGNKDDPLGEPWFAYLYHHFREWYEQTYGPALSYNGKEFIGVVFIRSLPFELRIPHTRREIETEGERIWLVFPSSLDDVEKPRKWVVDPPNLDRLSEQASTELDNQIVKLTSALRQISLNLNMATVVSEEFEGFVSGVQTELENAARNIVRNTADSLQIATWSIQMAMERTLKALSIQQRGKYRETHDLFTLFDDLEGISEVVSRDELKKLPRPEAAVSARYGHEPNIRLTDVRKSYFAAAEFIRLASGLFKYKYRIADARFLLQKPPWLELPPSPDNNEGETSE